MKKIGPFDLIDSASYTKEDLMESGEAGERDYSPYLANRSLSYHADSVLHANEMNFWRDLGGRLQYDYLRLSLRKRARRSKWSKPDDREGVELAARALGLSPSKAREVFSLLPDSYVTQLRKSMSD